MSCPQGFVPLRSTTFQQHQHRIEQLILEGMHDGKGWKPESFSRYNELEDQETIAIPVVKGSSPAAPTPPTNAAARQSDLGGFRGWNNPSRFIIEIEILLERLASETARADRAERERDSLLKCIGESDDAPTAVLATVNSTLAAAEADLQRCNQSLQDCILAAEVNKYPSLSQIRAELRGKDLACWCPLNQPCHADVLLEIANA